MKVYLILFCCFGNCFSLPKLTAQCPNGKICQNDYWTISSETWCCQENKICGETFDQCKDSFIDSVLRKFLIVILLFIFGCLCRCISSNIHCRNEPVTDYQSIPTTTTTTTTTHSVIVAIVEEESPPSYEQVMIRSPLNESIHSTG